MADLENELHFTVLYRGKPLQFKSPASSMLADLGKEIVDLTGVVPHTLRLMLPKRPPLQPMSEQHSTTLLSQSGITEGLTMKMMGVSSAEVAAVSQPSLKDRILGFSEEEQRARQRSGYAPGIYTLPKGNYIFCDFQTLLLPGIQLNPPPAMALRIMHKLACDRGITAIMDKYQWRVGVMTEMAPVGFVGISPKCILGYNKNRGLEISLRLRTDDLKGFRKYESIKKTLLHELAHMVHDEHDEKFHALDKQLNEEAITLDWTKSQSHTLSGVKFDEEEEAMDTGGVGSSRGYKLGGNAEQASFMDARRAAGEAALRRFGNAMKIIPDLGRRESSKMTSAKPSMSGVKPSGQPEPDPDEHEIRSMVAISEGANGVVEAAVRNQEPDPDEASNENVGKDEPDPDETSGVDSGKTEPDPDDAVHNVLKNLWRSQESDPNKASSGHFGKDEPDPDEEAETVLDFGVRSQEPDKASMDDSEKIEPDPGDAMNIMQNPPARRYEPDADEASRGDSGQNEPDPDEAVDIVHHALLRKQEPDPDEASSGDSGQNEPDPDEAVDVVHRAFLRSQEPDRDEAFAGKSGTNEPNPEAMEIRLEALVKREQPHLNEACSCHSGKNEPDPDDAVDIGLGESQGRAQESDPDEANDHTGKETPDLDTVHKSLISPLRSPEPDVMDVGSRGDEPDPDDANDKFKVIIPRNGCMGCTCTASKRMKSGTGSEFTEFFKPQMSR